MAESLGEYLVRRQVIAEKAGIMAASENIAVGTDNYEIIEIEEAFHFYGKINQTLLIDIAVFVFDKDIPQKLSILGQLLHLR